MSLLGSKGARRSAVGLSAVALFLGAALPGAVMGQSITLVRRSCDYAGSPTCLASLQSAVPIAAQKAEQTGTADPTATAGDQSNKVDQDADNANKSIQSTELTQEQASARRAGTGQSPVQTIRKSRRLPHPMRSAATRRPMATVPRCSSTSRKTPMRASTVAPPRDRHRQRRRQRNC